MNKLTIPPECMPVVEVLRRDVPRPTELPTLERALMRQVLRFVVGKMELCPMGMHKESTSDTPDVDRQFAGGQCDFYAVDQFAWWWDQQTDAQAAVDAVWPREVTTHD